MIEEDAEPAKDRRILFGVFVIAVLVVAAGIFFEMGNSFIGCKKTEPLGTVIAIESAVNSFYTEYSKLPDVGNRVTTNSPQGLKLLNMLLGLDVKSDDALNSRAIKFLVVREGKNKKNGLIYAADGKSVEALYDPWGSPYTVVLDTEYKEHLHFTNGTRVIDLKGRRSVAFSPGPDKIPGTSDDVVTW